VAGIFSPDITESFLGLVFVDVVVVVVAVVVIVVVGAVVGVVVVVLFSTFCSVVSVANSVLDIPVFFRGSELLLPPRKFNDFLWLNFLSEFLFCCVYVYF